MQDNAPIASKAWYSTMQYFSFKRTEDGEIAVKGSFLGFIFAVFAFLLVVSSTGVLRIGKFTWTDGEALEKHLQSEFSERLDAYDVRLRTITETMQTLNVQLEVCTSNYQFTHQQLESLHERDDRMEEKIDKHWQLLFHDYPKP